MKNTEFAARFIKAVEEAQINDKTQEGLGKLFGVSGVSIWSYRAGEKLPRMSTALRIAAALKVNVEWLLQGTGPMRLGGAAEQPPHNPAAVLLSIAGNVTPRSKTVLDRLNAAAENGSLTEPDLLLLDQIASRLLSKPRP